MASSSKKVGREKRRRSQAERKNRIDANRLRAAARQKRQRAKARVTGVFNLNHASGMVEVTGVGSFPTMTSAKKACREAGIRTPSIPADLRGWTMRETTNRPLPKRARAFDPALKLPHVPLWTVLGGQRDRTLVSVL
jgi:hypothetical protein